MVKIKNRNYSQMVGREELFERERHKEPVAGWHCCELACVEADRARKIVPDHLQKSATN
jgi:hypothetical protein